MKRRALLGTLVVGSTTFGMHSQAATIAWTGSAGDLNWSNAANWAGGGLPSHIAGLGSAISVPSVITDDGSARTLNQLSFLGLPAGSGVWVGGNALTLNGSGANKVILNSDATTLSPVTIDSPIALGGNVRVNAGGSKITLNGAIGETGGARNLVKANGAALEINGDNTFAGTTTILNGAVSLGHANALGLGTSAIQLGQAGTDNKVELGTRNGVVLGRDVEIVNKGVAATKTSVIGGVGAEGVAVSSTWTGTVFINQSVNLSAKTGTNYTNAASVQFSGNLVDGANLSAGGLVQKTESGTVRLAGSNNTYSPATTVTTGTLLVNRRLSSLESVVTVKSGARLGGTGSIGRPVNVETGGILSPGGVGTLTVDADRAVTFASGSILEWDLGASGGDSINTGSVSFGSDLTIKLRNTGANLVDPSATLVLLNWTAADPSSIPNLVIDSTSALTGSLSFVGEADGVAGGQIVLAGVSEQVPEPGGVWGIGAAMMLWRRRRKRTCEVSGGGA